MLTDEQFDAQSQVIKDQRKAGLQEAIAKRDKALAELFRKSGWTKERIAKRIAKLKRNTDAT